MSMHMFLVSCSYQHLDMQMVHEREARRTQKTLPDIEEKTISEDEAANLEVKYAILRINFLAKSLSVSIFYHFSLILKELLRQFLRLLLIFFLQKGNSESQSVEENQPEPPEPCLVKAEACLLNFHTVYIIASDLEGNPSFILLQKIS